MNLFGENDEVIRTLGFYQPFGSLMLHGKIETRWVRKGKKPPFPLGKYLFYTTVKRCDDDMLMDWVGQELFWHLINTLKGDPTKTNELDRYAIGIGYLVNLRPMTKEDERKCFVKFIGERIVKDKDDNKQTQVQWCLEFKGVQAIVPFEFNYGKQGVGILPEWVRQKINLVISE